MKKRTILLAALSSFLVPTANAQLLKEDIDAVLKTIPIIPPTVEALHDNFTGQTNDGEKFLDGELLDPPYQTFKGFVRDIHREAIVENMKTNTRTEFADTVRYEDERWKLALRPLLGADAKAKVHKLNTPIRDKILQIIEMQTKFDWPAFYKAEEKIKKSYMEKISLLNIENSGENLRKKILLEKEAYRQRRDLWVQNFNNYSRGLSDLTALFKSINYGESLSDQEKKIILPLLADVQVRALEAVEKMIWAEMSLATFAEMVYNEQEMLKLYFPVSNSR